MRWFNDMGEQLKQQGQQFTQRATGAIKEFKEKLAEKTEDISKKFQEQKDKVLTPRNIATLKQIKEQLQETNNQFQVRHHSKCGVRVIQCSSLDY